jgi:DNA-directed RNA polymerase specialized sigma24 family protein
MAKGNHVLALTSLDTLFNVGAMSGLTDAQLLERFRSRRDDAAEMAISVLIERHGPMVLRVCEAVLRDRDEAHDAFQATFLVLVQKALGLWVRESLGPWLYQVAHRIALKSRSARARRLRYERRAALQSSVVRGERTVSRYSVAIRRPLPGSTLGLARPGKT